MTLKRSSLDSLRPETTLPSSTNSCYTGTSPTPIASSTNSKRFPLLCIPCLHAIENEFFHFHMVFQALLVSDFGPRITIKIVESLREDILSGKLKSGSEIKVNAENFTILNNSMMFFIWISWVEVFCFMRLKYRIMWINLWVLGCIEEVCVGYLNEERE